VTADQILHALAQHKYGIQINMTKRDVIVATRYTPLVKGVGRTVKDAAQDCVWWLLDVLEDYPERREQIPDVLKALKLLGCTI
jgi:hypothetical protein